MEKILPIIRKRRLHDSSPKAAIWVSATPQERLAALEIIRSAADAQQELPRVYQVTRRRRR
jgi:hypothetical protein